MRSPKFDCVTHVNLLLFCFDADVESHKRSEGCRRWKEIFFEMCSWPLSTYIVQFIYLSCATFHLCEIDNKLHFNLKRRRKNQQGLAEGIRREKKSILIYGFKVFQKLPENYHETSFIWQSFDNAHRFQNRFVKFAELDKHLSWLFNYWMGCTGVYGGGKSWVFKTIVANTFQVL